MDAKLGGGAGNVGVCGFDPMLVKGYVKTGFRALWWHIPDELYEEFQTKPNDTISGKLLKVWKGSVTDDPAPLTHEPNEDFNWKFTRESGLAVLSKKSMTSRYGRAKKKRAPRCGPWTR